MNVQFNDSFLCLENWSKFALVIVMCLTCCSVMTWKALNAVYRWHHTIEMSECEVWWSHCAVWCQSRLEMAQSSWMKIDDHWFLIRGFSPIQRWDAPIWTVCPILTTNNSLYLLSREPINWPINLNPNLYMILRAWLQKTQVSSLKGSIIMPFLYSLLWFFRV